MEKTSDTTIFGMVETIEDQTSVFNNDNDFQKNLVQTDSISIQDKREKVIFDLIQDSKRCDLKVIDKKKGTVEQPSLCVPKQLSEIYSVDSSGLTKQTCISHVNISDCDNHEHSYNTETSKDQIKSCPENGKLISNDMEQSNNLNNTLLEYYDPNLEKMNTKNNIEISKLEISCEIQSCVEDAKQVNELLQVEKFAPTSRMCISDNKHCESVKIPDDTCILVSVPKDKISKNLFDQDKSIETEPLNYSHNIKIDSAKNAIESNQELSSPNFKSMSNNNKDLPADNTSSLVIDFGFNRGQSNTEDKEVIETLNKKHYLLQSTKIPVSQKLKSIRALSTESFKLKPCQVNLTKVRVAESSSLFDSKPCLSILKRKLEEMLHDSTKQEDNGIKEIKRMRQERSRAYGNLLKELTRVKNNIKTIK